MAEIFLPEDRRAKIKDSGYRNIAKGKIREGTYEYIIARTAYFDAFFLDCLKSGFAQIVLLGAGYDSRALRFKDRLKGAKIFEVDAAFTQNQKIEILNKNNMDSGHVDFVAADFEKNDFADMLVEAGFDKVKTSAFIWEGVAMYLSEKAVRDTLRNIMEISANGSLIGLDYLCFKPDPDSEIIRKDEIVQFGMDMETMEAFLGQYGFSAVENLRTVKKTMNFIKAVFINSV